MTKGFLLRLWGRLALPSWLQWRAAWLTAQKFLVAVSALVLNESGEVLLCHHTYRPVHPWGLPGGGLHRGERPERAIEREVLEETGLVVRAQRLLLVTSAGDRPHVGLIYHCQQVGGSFRPSAEVSGARFYALDALPDGLLGLERRTIERAIQRLDAPEA